MNIRTWLNEPSQKNRTEAAERVIAWMRRYANRNEKAPDSQAVAAMVRSEYESLPSRKGSSPSQMEDSDAIYEEIAAWLYKNEKIRDDMLWNAIRRVRILAKEIREMPKRHIVDNIIADEIEKLEFPLLCEDRDEAYWTVCATVYRTANKGEK